MHWLARVSGDVLSLSLAVVAGVLVTLAVVQTWASDAIFDADRFAGTAVRVLERDDVRGEVRRVIVDQAIAQQPDLVTARPLLETVVNTALTSKAVERSSCRVRGSCTTPFSKPTGAASSSTSPTS
ncbi:MAG: hypothetical protein M5U18_12810 [Dehalococcoidia bacterium]|nr:hypothetical protein [Dehalococcoidia bacterium]